MDIPWQDPSDFFNTRELATGFWLIVLTVVSLSWYKTRQSLIGVIRAATQWKLLILFGSLGLYISGICWILSSFDLWSTSQIAQTILWFFLSGVLLLGRSLTAKDDDQYFRKIITDSLKVVVLFEFIVVAYTFNIFVELLFVPTVALLAALLAISETKDEYRPARILFEIIFSIIGLVLIWYSISRIWYDPAQFFTTDNGRNFLLPIFLTIGSVPLFYLWYCISNLENAFIRINFKQFQPKELKQLAKRKFFIAFFFKPWLLNRATRQFQLIPAKHLGDIDKIIDEIRNYEREAKKPPLVDAHEGWSPYVARDFLKDYGLKTGDYHSGIGEGAWGAISSHVNLDNSTLPNTATYYIEGARKAVTLLKLSGCFYNNPDPADAINKFHDIAVNLTAAALSISTDEAYSLLPHFIQFEITHTEIKIACEIHEHVTHGGFDVIYVIQLNSESADPA